MQAERLLCLGAVRDFIYCKFPNVMEKNERDKKPVRNKKIAMTQTGENPLNGFCPVFCVYDEPSTDLCLHKNLYLAKSLKNLTQIWPWLRA